MAAKKKTRKGKSKRELPNLKRGKFLAAYAQCGNLTQAAKLAGINRDSHYKWLQDPGYERDFAIAHSEACEWLEAEARRRAVQGTEEPLSHQGRIQYKPQLNEDGSIKRNEEGHVLWTDTPEAVRKYSDVLLIFLMKGAMPHKYRDNFKGEVKDLAAAAVRGADVFQELTDEELDNLEKLSRAAAERRRDRGGKATTGPEPDPTVLP